MKLEGVITALVTPFRSGQVDYESFARLLTHQLEAQVDGFVINGTTGESPTLSWREVEKLFALARDQVKGKVPLLLGTGSNSTAKTVEMTALAGALKADAALVVTPYYNKPPQRGLVAHFQKVADSSPVPIVLYNVPGRTVAALSIPTVEELASHPRIMGLKEASGDLQFLAELRQQVPEDFVLLSGDDPTCVEFCRRGGRGVISVISHIIPTELKQLVGRAMSGDDGAVQDYARFAALNRLIYLEANPIPVKMALALMEVIESAELRLPLIELAEEHRAPLEQELIRLKKRKERKW